MDETKVRGILATTDRMDPEEFSRVFTEDASFRFGNGEPVVGPQAIGEAVSGFWSTIEGMNHETIGIWTGEWENGEVYSAEANVHYTRPDGSVVTIPTNSTLRMNGELVQDWRIFSDLSPLFS